MHFFQGQSVAGLLVERCQLTPDAPFLIWAAFNGIDRTWTYAQFGADVARIAGGLLAKGVGRGDRVVLLLENCPEALLALFACAWIGAVCVPINAASTAIEFAYILERTGPSGIVTQPKLLSVASSCPANCLLAVTATDGGEVAAVLATEADARRVEAFDSLFAAPVDCISVEPSDPACILFTSGTTGRPKGVVWTHANVLWGAKMGALQEGLRADDVHLVFLPLFHVVGLTWSVLPSLWVGGSLVLQPRFSGSRFWETALRHRCTWASMVPFCTAVLARYPIPAQHHFRMWGHAVYSPAVETRFGVKLLGWWGMTEIVTQGLVGDASLRQIAGTIGQTSVGYRVRVVNDDGVDVPPGEVGELRILGERGLSLFLEYLGDPEATQVAFDEAGYFRTGDRVRVSEGGAIEFVDRARDVIKVGGENVAATDVERVIAEVPGVREVSVVSAPDAMLGEVAVAFVIRDETFNGEDVALIESVLDRCRRDLSRFKVPREVLVVETLPRVSIGKVSKAELRAGLRERPPVA